VQGALTWLENNQDKPLEELQASNQAAGDEDEEAPGTSVAPLAEGENAKSLVCNECGKKFRNHDQATFHATKTYVGRINFLPRYLSPSTHSNSVGSEHTDFSESTDEIAPLTEAERKARLEELRQKLNEKKAAQAAADKEDAKRNEVCITLRRHFIEPLMLNLPK